MNSQVDLLIVGAGPAGMSAAIKAREYGLAVLIVDEQPEPGGQIWRGIERVGETPRARILGAAYLDGIEVAERFRRSGAEFAPETTLWHIEEGPVAFLRSNGVAYRLAPKAVLLATGAQERPTPFKGWTLPGVMTVGAGQILLKSSGLVPDGPLWIAGSGPLAYLYAAQLLKSGTKIAGFLDTQPKGRIANNVGASFAALIGQPIDLLKGLSWLAQIKRRCQYVAHVDVLEAEGTDRLEKISFTTEDRKSETVTARSLLVHEGIIPSIHPTMALDCQHRWNGVQECYEPAVDNWGETSKQGVYVAGDLAGIAGAKAACIRGEIAAIGIAQKLTKLTHAEAERVAKPVMKRLKSVTAARPFLDKVYRPRPAAFIPEDGALACRCEEVTVRKVRDLCRAGKGDPNRIKAFSRAGMGACQGRMCNYTVASVLADETGSEPSAIGLYRIRPPFKPLTLDELAQLQTFESA